MTSSTPAPRSRRRTDPCDCPVERWSDAATLLRAASHPVRLHLLRCLADGPRCVGDLNELVSVSQPMLSQHMTALRKVGLVDCHAQANRRCYYLVRPEFVERLLALLEEDHPRHAPSRDEVFRQMEERHARAPRRARSMGKKRGLTRGS